LVVNNKLPFEISPLILALNTNACAAMENVRYCADNFSVILTYLFVSNIFIGIGVVISGNNLLPAEISSVYVVLARVALVAR